MRAASPSSAPTKSTRARIRRSKVSESQQQREVTMQRLWVRLGMRLVIGLGVAVLLCASALAQGRPDFTGTWRFNQQKSTPGIAGNTPNIAFPSQIVAKQS